MSSNLVLGEKNIKWKRHWWGDLKYSALGLPLVDITGHSMMTGATIFGQNVIKTRETVWSTFINQPKKTRSRVLHKPLKKT